MRMSKLWHKLYFGVNYSCKCMPFLEPEAHNNTKKDQESNKVKMFIHFQQIASFKSTKITHLTTHK